jgi:hypothetical protein
LKTEFGSEIKFLFRIRDDDIFKFLFLARDGSVPIMRIFLMTNLLIIKDRALALRVEREERALRAEEAGLELLHRASGSGVRRSAVELRRVHHRQLQINERRKLSVPPPPPSSVSSTSSLEERGQAAVQPALPAPEAFPMLHLLQVNFIEVLNFNIN